jgi:DNA-binding NtrC family response regulator
MTVRGSILLVDDEERILKTLGRALRDEGHDVYVTVSGKKAQGLLSERSFDLLIVDNRMPDVSGLDLIRELSKVSPESERPEVLMMTAHATVESAIEAMKLGAFDYLQKPFEVEELLVVVGKALSHRRLASEHRYLLSERKTEFNDYGIVGSSAPIRAVNEKLEQVAKSKSTVLIRGETGTGKELAARAIHDRSAERDMPLIKVNCAAIPENLLESELFGHVKGAFTHATSNKKGRFSLAHGSSIFLDEIGTMSTAIQAKLLRVLQEREFEPLGSERTEKVDVRVIAATNRDLGRMMASGEFQEDLYYRLSVIPIELPPLRARREDVPALVSHFVAKHRRRTGKSVERVTDEALAALSAYDWPGNVRELANVMERAVILCEGQVIQDEHIGVLGRSRSAVEADVFLTLEEMERQHIQRALARTGGVLAGPQGAARLLGMRRSTVWSRMRKLGIQGTKD